MTEQKFIIRKPDREIIPLTIEEILEGNKLMLKFEDLDYNKSDKWIIECAKYDRSWDVLIPVAEKISLLENESYRKINALAFNFRHQMLHEVLNKREEFYRTCVKAIKKFFELVETQD